MSKIVLKGSPTDLTVLELLSPADLFSEGGTAPVYDAIKKEVADFVPDISNESGRKEVAALAYKITRSKTFLDNLGKTYNAKLKEMPKAVDKERALIWDKLEALQKEIRKPLTEWEEKEKARIDAHKAALSEMEALNVFTDAQTTEGLRLRLERLKEINSRDWEENSDFAVSVFLGINEALGKKIAASEQTDRERAELEALRSAKAERDAKDAEAQRLADEEAQKVRIEREARENALREAEEKIKAAEEKAAKQKAEDDRRIREAEDAKIAAEAKAKADSELAVQRERDRAETEKKKQEEEAKARENDRAHHAKINREVMEAIQIVINAHMSGKDTAKEIVIAIASGNVPHTKISY